MSLRALLVSLVCMLVGPVAALADQRQSIGSAVAIINVVTAAYEADKRSLAVGDPVTQDELIEVGLDASGEIVLQDDTKLALGPGARLLLDRFVYDPKKNSSGSILINLTKGAFRFVTGVAAKPTYVIRTPVAAITVRGTIFDVYIQDSGLSWLLLHEGGVNVCNTTGDCRDLDQPGKLLRVLPDGTVSLPILWSELPGRGLIPFAKAFPFVVRSPSIDPKPIFTEDKIKLGKIDDAPPPDANDTPPKTSPPKRTYRPKPKRRPKKKAYRPKPKPKTAKKPSGPTAGEVAAGIGFAIGVGKVIGGMKKKKHPKPPGRGSGNHGKPNY